MNCLYPEDAFPEDKTGTAHDFKEWIQAGMH